jgi:hypothetical protein
MEHISSESRSKVLKNARKKDNAQVRYHQQQYQKAMRPANVDPTINENRGDDPPFWTRCLPRTWPVGNVDSICWTQAIFPHSFVQYHITSNRRVTGLKRRFIPERA